MSDAAFVDTECTGLRPDDEIWEFAGLRRYADRSSSWLHMLIEHDEMRAATGLPEPFQSQYLARRGSPEERWPRKRAALAIAEFLGDAVMVGAVPTFDSLHLTALLHRYGILAPNLYHVVDAFPPRLRAQIRSGLYNYASTVVRQEWPARERDQAVPPQASEELENVTEIGRQRQQEVGEGNRFATRGDNVPRGLGRKE